MAKIDENLINGEEVIVRAEKNPIALAIPVAILVLGFIIGCAAGGFTAGLVVAILVALFCGVLKMVLAYFTDELAITNKRVYGRCKPKLIGSEELDMPVDKINSISVNKGFLGSILGYSTVTVKSFGDGWVFPFVKNSTELKNKFYEIQGK